ncbi:response regulator [Methanogenium sp. MK-MG]|uniref:response regulator n=1 Tax=Methanogenium sp. MK-MG TaxID=2599926 RepID=UPI0013EC1941|nr:response regulator [Methanogenium sp. MK-MG]
MGTILVCNDSHFQRRIPASIVERNTHAPLETINEQGFWDIAKEKKPDPVFQDLLMPDDDGFAVLEHAREQALSIPINVMEDIPESRMDTPREFISISRAAVALNEIGFRKILREAGQGNADPKELKTCMKLQIHVAATVAEKLRRRNGARGKNKISPAYRNMIQE